MPVCFPMENHQSQSRQTERCGSSALLDEGEAIGSDQLQWTNAMSVLYTKDLTRIQCIPPIQISTMMNGPCCWRR